MYNEVKSTKWQGKMRARAAHTKQRESSFRIVTVMVAQ